MTDKPDLLREIPCATGCLYALLCAFIGACLGITFDAYAAKHMHDQGMTVDFIPAGPILGPILGALVGTPIALFFVMRLRALIAKVRAARQAPEPPPAPGELSN
jgi:hypothetical protein